MAGPNDSTLTAERAREMFSYDVSSGKLCRRLRTSNRINVGDEAGWIVQSRRNHYREVRVGGVSYLAHRLVWLICTGEWPRGQIDHQDGNGLNNRFENLRDVPHKFNQRNAAKRYDNTSGVSGVTWHKRSGKWQARITVDGQERSLGLFASLDGAAAERKRAEALCGFHKNHGRDRAPGIGD